MTDDELLGLVGREWNDLPSEAAEGIDPKFLDRPRTLRRAHEIIKKYLPELGRPEHHMEVVDVSCGNSSFLEAARAYGAGVIGIDNRYASCAASQGIAYIDHDCQEFPYPLAGQGVDIVSCQGAITFYCDAKGGLRPAAPTAVLDEFARIARRAILLSVNKGEIRDRILPEIAAWESPGWHRELSGPTWWRWARRD